jgi:hypothetical protein
VTVRSLFVALALAAPCIGAGRAAAQESGADGPPTVLLPPHHREDVPDYLAGIAAPGTEPIHLPSPPADGATYVPPHHRGVPPDYLATIEPIPRESAVVAIAVPAPPPGESPAVVRGLYVNAWVFGSSRFYDLVALADSTEINALVIDVKDATGYTSYRSSVATAVEIGANDLVRAPNARARLALLERQGIHAIARIVVARDALLARRKPDWAIQDRDGGLWHDGLGEPWVDAYHDSVWIYAGELAAEAVLMGFNEIQFDYVRFPDEPASRLERAVFAARRLGESRRAAIRRQVTMLRDRVTGLGVPFTLDVFGLTTAAAGDMGIGQSWDDLSQLADVLLPMVYPSHYPRGAYGIAYPNAEPYETVRRAVLDGVRRSAALPRAARIRPYLQAFTLRRPRYTAAEVRAQIEAVEDLGLTDWVLWNARGVYPDEALRRVVGPVGDMDGDVDAAPAAGDVPLPPDSVGITPRRVPGRPSVPRP